MIRIISTDPSITRKVSRTESDTAVTDTFVRTDFLADEETDITAMNAEGSEYLKYPAGSMVYCVESKKKYILKADCTEYTEV